MIEVTTKKFIFKKKNIWFSDSPFDVRGCDAVFFFACKNKVSLDGFIRTEDHTFIIDLTQDIDSIWKGISKRVRTYIKRAKKLEVEIKINHGHEEFKRLFFNFATQKGFKPPTEPFDIMKNHGTLFSAYYNGKLIAGTLTIDDTNIMREYIRASKRLEITDDNKMKEIMNVSSKLMVWEAIVYAKEQGKQIYDFGGYYPTEDKNDPRYTIKIFKQRFGGKPVVYYKYTKYYSVLYRLIKNLLSLKK
ncbi:MAG: peptidoglycan bridge formation glycyltransferase FemA/FemB family protein [Desulfonauticus sp.]|nr:peptidoglycan bridge formation glycyltransferase FemA/FemB family protein [Desulfonauticus sp.]